MNSILTFLAAIDIAMCPAVASLDARFRTREAISNALIRCGPLARPALLRGLKSGRAEVEGRSRWVLGQIDHARAVWVWARSGELLPHRGTRLPWLHLLPGGYGSEAVGQYLQAVHVDHPHSVGDDGWPDWRYATQLWVATRLTDHADEAAVVADLDRMAWAEAVWSWGHYGLWRLLPSR